AAARGGRALDGVSRGANAVAGAHGGRVVRAYPRASSPFMHPVSRTVIQTAAVSIERVFAVLPDPSRMAEWLPGCAGTQSDKPLRKGVRFKVRFGQRMTEFEVVDFTPPTTFGWVERSEEHTSELQSRRDLVCRLLLEKKKKTTTSSTPGNDQANSEIVSNQV